MPPEAQIGAVPTARPPESTTQEGELGSSPSNPIPLGSPATIEDVTLTIFKVIFPADEVAKQGSSLNPTPPGSAHYLLVRVAQTCGAPTPGSCHLGPLRLLDSSGEVHFPNIDLTGVPCEIPLGEFPAGEAREVCLVFLAPEGDENLALRYESFFGEEAYFALR